MTSTVEQAGGDHGAQHDHRHGERQRQQTAHPADGGAQDEGEENGDGDRDQDVLAEIERQDRHRGDKGDGDGAGETGVALVCAGELDLHGRPSKGGGGHDDGGRSVGGARPGHVAHEITIGRGRWARGRRILHPNEKQEAIGFLLSRGGSDEAG